MTQTIIYTCDFCKSVGKIEDLHVVTVSTKAHGYYGSKYDRSVHACNTCMDSMQIVPIIIRKPEVADEATLESLIRQIVREELPAQ